MVQIVIIDIVFGNSSGSVSWMDLLFEDGSTGPFLWFRLFFIIIFFFIITVVSIVFIAFFVLFLFIFIFVSISILFIFFAVIFLILPFIVFIILDFIRRSLTAQQGVVLLIAPGPLSRRLEHPFVVTFVSFVVWKFDDQRQHEERVQESSREREREGLHRRSRGLLRPTGSEARFIVI